MNEYEPKRKAFEERTVNFSVNIIRTCGKYSKSFELRPLIDQIIRSAASVGANYAEANNSSSKADFKNKIYIAKKEVAETRYWLRILKQFVAEDLSELEQEALEPNKILHKVISTMKTNGSENGK